MTMLLLSLLPVPGVAGRAIPMFSDDGVLAVRLEAPFSTLMRERSETEDLAGMLRYTDSAGKEQVFDVKLRARGRYRRDSDTCRFPPVRLNFKKGQLDGTEFDGLDKVKLVTHCQNLASYEQNVLDEYLAYRIFNLLTEYSFRVRLLHVDYVDKEAHDKSVTRYGFLIEDDDLLEKRIDMKRAELPRISSSQLMPSEAALVVVFQYLIANTDFSMVAGPKDDICCHNIVLFDAGDDKLLPIPYDFDFAGLVNARYATPNPRLKIRRVTTRLYRGHCAHNAQVPGALAQVMEAHERVVALVDAVPGMDDSTRKKARAYLEGFYREMAAPDAAERRLIKECS